MDYFESGTEKKKKEINNVRSRTFQKLGSKTNIGADTKRELDRLIQTSAGRTHQDLLSFLDNLHNKQSSSTRDTPIL